MASVSSQLIEEVTAHAQSGSLEDARKICADGIYFPNNLRTCLFFRYQNFGHGAKTRVITQKKNYTFPQKRLKNN